MPKDKPVFVADTCIGGLSVLKSLWVSGYSADVNFLADYQINPLGLKDDAFIAGVVERWMKAASEHADTLIIACNTLSIRYRHLLQSGANWPSIGHVVSMVDCFEAMLQAESDRLTGKNVLVIGTKYTVAQSVYQDALTAAVPGVRVQAIAATELERQVAHIQPWDSESCTVLTSELREAIANTDYAVLACTCFPIVKIQLQALFPDVVFLDPGEYCSEYLPESGKGQSPKLRLHVTGDVVAATEVASFARSYLESDSVLIGSNDKPVR